LDRRRIAPIAPIAGKSDLVSDYNREYVRYRNQGRKKGSSESEPLGKWRR